MTLKIDILHLRDPDVVFYMYTFNSLNTKFRF